MVVHPFNPSTWEADAGDLREFEVSLVYRPSPKSDRPYNYFSFLKEEKPKVKLR